MRMEILRGPVAQGGKTKSGEWVVNQDAYDLVDIVEAGFVSDSYSGKHHSSGSPPQAHIAHGQHEHSLVV